MRAQIPSQLAAERVGLPRWIGIIMLCWGIVATSMVGLTRSPAHFYVVRFLLGEHPSPTAVMPSIKEGLRCALMWDHNPSLPGVFEAGTFPALWAYLAKFYAGGPQLAAAWGFIATAQPIAQVLPRPLFLPCRMCSCLLTAAA